MGFLVLIGLRGLREPVPGEVALQGHDGKDPALADLAAGQHAGAGLQAHRFGVRAEQGRCAGQVDGRGGRVVGRPRAGRARSATDGMVDRV
ncbi:MULTISPECIES: hypothetical protein [Burkholderia]|uniref:hypothetical protein n=1 Tax=Burkholderia TaxID=32008 RepID=UPI0007593937|nr:MULTISPECIES: hypothetical protein [Burkholderia]AMU16316.1 hypothetical protein A3203_26005 [Burkholderia cenocepacia]KVF57849.1 hypothetical protein WJ14_14150 [Burkholderia cenocepacia]MBG0863421.1 hypothetical protein [Burkholderia sp. 9779_493]MBJ9896967.1 hypothetical protein [Burkholderia cenocepacia]MBJ9916391.1 hypothetical protein [Burkholderia cenocepacia]